MQVVTFFAECVLPPAPAEKSRGFDWHQAIKDLSRSVLSSLHADTVLVTDKHTAVNMPALRVGDAKADGIMLWLLDAQAEAVRVACEPLLMVSPDTLITGSLKALWGDWDLCLLTRERPTPIINSVIAVRPSPRVTEIWSEMAKAARKVEGSRRAWGVDVDVIVDAFHVKPSEDCVRTVDGVRVRLLPTTGIFESVRAGVKPATPIWDFKGSRKRLMPQYAAML